MNGVVLSVDGENRVIVFSHEGGPDSTHTVDEKAYISLNKVDVRLEELLEGDAVSHYEGEPLVTIVATRDTSAPVATSKVTAKAKAEDKSEEVSEVQTMLVPEAIDHIGRMRSEDKLKHIAANDTRKSVQDAATKRLADLK